MKRKELNEIEIADKIKAGIGFEVVTIRERKRALTAAKYLGVLIHTRATDTGYYVHFLTSSATI